MKETKGQRMTMNQVYGYLASRGVPKMMIHAIRYSLIQDAITEGTDMKYDRIYTGIALAVRRAYDLEAEEILKALREFDKIAGSVLIRDDETAPSWTDIMQELKDETGLVIHTGPDDRLVCELADWKGEENEE